jgi:hypothetical protein
MSSAAALAVDSGASPIAQLGYTPEQQSQEQSNTPISDAVPSNYQSLLGSQNDGQPFDARFEDATVQQGNAQADNAGKSIFNSMTPMQRMQWVGQLKQIQRKQHQRKLFNQS